MNTIHQTVLLIEKEFRLEWRNRSAITGVMIYVISTVFICYMSFRRIIDIPTWNALFWIIMTFAAVNAVAKSFMNERRGLQLYYFTLLNPVAVIFSKILYNSFLLCSIALINFLAYSVFMGNPVVHITGFLSVLILGSIALASNLTLVSAIAARAGNSPSLLAILSFPVLIPLLMTLISLSLKTLTPMVWSDVTAQIVIVAALTAVVSALSYLLFPYLWRD
jgi:heme exporter protein B